MKTTRPSRQSGFTIIELSISMAMLSVLMLIVIFSILNIIGVYNKGITLKRVNQSGRTIAAEVQSDLRSAVPTNVVSKKINLSGTFVTTAVCTGTDSYMWNVWAENGNTTSRFADTNELITMIKINDPGGEYCKPPYPLPEKSNSKVLLGDELVIRTPVEVNSRGKGNIFQFEFTISTPDGNNDIIYDSSGRGSCGGGKESEFCALNTFVVTSYAKGI